MDRPGAYPRATRPDEGRTFTIPLENGLGFRIGRLARAMRQQWSRQLHSLELSPPQAAVLRGVIADPGCSLRGLARLLHSDPMNVKRCVDDLQQRGLVRSGHLDSDRRPRTLDLTPEGVALARQVTDLVAIQQKQLRTLLTNEEWQVLNRSLETLENEFVTDTSRTGDAVDFHAPNPTDEETS